MSFSSLVRIPGKIWGGSPNPQPIRENQKSEHTVQRLQYARVLSGLDNPSPNAAECTRAWKLMQEDMAMIPAGTTFLMVDSFDDPDPRAGDEMQNFSHQVEVGGTFIDRLAVTNADFLSFVKAGGYDNLELWPQEVWQNVVQFVDQTGKAGPRWWSQGRPGRDLMDHPVVGVCWFEAAAYANWVGKRLPMAAEWQRASSWHVSKDGKHKSMKYPWGDAFEVSKANTWSSGIGTTVSVTQFYEGCTPNGIYQLVGNIWEWTNSRFECGAITETTGEELGEIRGGAFDTYFPNHATCQFRTGQTLLFRSNNIGFRCCAPISQLTHVPGKSM